MEPTPEEQANGRYVLMSSAKMAKLDGFSMIEWMEAADVLNCCRKYELEENLLEHIAWMVWHPIDRS